MSNVNSGTTTRNNSAPNTLRPAGLTDLLQSVNSQIQQINAAQLSGATLSGMNPSFETITIADSVQTISSLPSATTHTITIDTESVADVSLTGYTINVYKQVGTTVSLLFSGSSPYTFTGTPGVIYWVEPQDFGPYVFDFWDSGVYTRYRQILVGSANATYTAYYANAAPPPPPPSPPSPPPPSPPVTSTEIAANTINQYGAATTGYDIELYPTAADATSGTGMITSQFSPALFTSLTAGTTYYLTAQSFSPCTFQNWDNGNTSYRAITPGNTVTATYSCTGASPPPPSPPGTGSSNLGLIIPYYGAPDSNWTAIIAAKNANPSLQMILIANPNSGPGDGLGNDGGGGVQTTFNNTTNGIPAMVEAGITVIGYIDTGYGPTGDGPGVSLTDVQAEMLYWKDNYPAIEGFFLDEMDNSDTTGPPSYYTSCTNYAHNTLGLSPVFGNPGTSSTSAYIGSVDVITSYETYGLPTASTVYSICTGTGGTRTQWGILPYGLSSSPSSAYFASIESYVTWIFCSDQGTSASNGPGYDDLPSFMNTLIANMLSGGGTS